MVPVYNAAEHIEKTAELLLGQTLKEIEIILVNDGSTDESGVICERLAEEHENIICVSTPNRGVSSARNTGIKAAKGEYVGFCDADDYPSLRLYETLYITAVENRADISMVKYAKQCKGKTVNADGDGSLLVYKTKQQVLRDFFSDKILSGVYTKIFKRELLGKVCFEEGRKINEDKKFIFDAILNSSSWCFRDESLYTYVRREGSASFSEFSDKYLDIIYFAKNIEDSINREFPELSDIARANTAAGYLQVLKIICKSQNFKSNKPVFNKCADALKEYSLSFCKRYLRKNDFFKLFILRVNRGAFRFIVGKYAED